MKDTKKKLTRSLVAVALVGIIAVPAYALNGFPASKAAVAIGQITALGTASASTNNGASSDTGWIRVMQTFIKTANAKDLSFDLAAQCGLVTNTQVKSKGGAIDTSSARGKVRFRIEVFDVSGSAEPNRGGISLGFAFPSQQSGVFGDPAIEEGVTYCDRFQQLEAQFAGLNCTADLRTGAVTCTDPEVLRLILKTLGAHAFNYLFADAPPGVKRIEVQARATANVALGGSELGAATAEAFVGLGSLLVEELRLIKGADTTSVIVELP